MKPLRLVLDTNVVLDTFHFADPSTRLLHTAIARGDALCFYDRDSLAELERVLSYPAFALTTAAQAALTERYRARATRLDAATGESYRLPLCRDPDDQKFLVLAARSQADALLTRDRALLELARRRPSPPFTISTASALIQAIQAQPGLSIIIHWREGGWRGFFETVGGLRGKHSGRSPTSKRPPAAPPAPTREQSAA